MNDLSDKGVSYIRCLLYLNLGQQTSACQATETINRKKQAAAAGGEKHKEAHWTTAGAPSISAEATGGGGSAIRIQGTFQGALQVRQKTMQPIHVHIMSISTRLGICEAGLA